jgi:uncharacterized SAM-binding protein YcdF (DUF218 family)
MFYILAKVLGFVALASNAVLVLGLLGLAISRSRRFKRFGHFLMGASIMLFAVLGLSPLGNLLIEPLEERFPVASVAPGTDIAGIIVLGGAVDTHIATTRHQPALTDSAERMTVVSELSRKFPTAKIIFTGGVSMAGGAIWNEMTESDVAKQLFNSFGIPDDRMIFEGKSRDTYENAQFTRDLIKPAPGQRFLLVTSGYHMPRSVGLFRKAGFDIVPYPVNFRTAGSLDAWRPFYSVADGLRQCNLATREWVGLLSYWLSGRIDDLFPKP